MEGDKSNRDRSRGDEFADYRSAARGRAIPDGGANSRPRWSASARVPGPPAGSPAPEHNPGPPAEWPPRRPAPDRWSPALPQEALPQEALSQERWREDRPREAWTQDPVPPDRGRRSGTPPRNGRSHRNGAPSGSPEPGAWPARDGEAAAWPRRDGEAAAWPRRDGEAAAWPPPEHDQGGWAPPVIAPPGTAPPGDATRPVRGGEAAGWAPVGSNGTATARDPATARSLATGRAATSAGGSKVAVTPKVPATTEQDPDGKAGRKSMPLWQELPLLLVVAFCLAVLIRTFLLQAFYIPSGSMEDTLLIGDRVLVNKVVYDVRDPKRGEVVVFRGPSNWVPETPTNAKDDGFVGGLAHTVGDLVGISTPGEKDFIKRVIGLPGDTVACCDDKGRVTVNGTPLDEPYVIENSPLDTPPLPGECRSRKFGPVKVDDGQMFVMGDHRRVSQDSRCQGQVPIDNVIGRAFVIVWPNSRWDSLPVPATFGHVGQASAAGQSRPADGAPSHPRTATSDMPGTVAVLLPFGLSWYISARSRHSSTGRQRRLAP